MRTKSLALVLSGLVMCIVVLCPLVSSAQDAQLRVGILPVLDTLPLQVAKRDGLFKEQGLDVELVPFASALERDTAMQSGQLDGYFGDILATLLLIQHGVPMRIVTVSYATTPGQPMFALLRAPHVGEDASTLDVGMSRSTIIEYLLDGMRSLPETKGLQLKNLEVKQIPIRLQMILAGQMDAALLPEPLAHLAESKGATVLATDEQLNMPLTVICLHKDKEDLVEPFMKAYGLAVERINSAPESYRALMVETCRVPKELASSFPVYHFPEPALPTEQEIWPVQQWMLTRGMLDSMLDYEILVP